MGDDPRAILQTLDPKARATLADVIDLLTMYPDARRRVVRTDGGELTAEDRPLDPRGRRSRAVCLVTLSVAMEAQVKGHMRWSSGFDQSRGRR
jgi:hypothetical protein